VEEPQRIESKQVGMGNFLISKVAALQQANSVVQREGSEVHHSDYSRVSVAMLCGGISMIAWPDSCLTARLRGVTLDS
jgi:hypothetical protein